MFGYNKVIMADVQKPPLNAYWVEPGRLMAGEYPASSSGPKTRSNIGWLLANGVDCFVDLTEKGEYGLKSYRKILDEESRKYEKTIEYIRREIRDMSVPTTTEMMDTLDAIEEYLDTGQTVYIHCYGGKGRTGTVIGCWLVRGGWSGYNALNRITDLRQNLLNSAAASPETTEQREMVLNWNANM